MRFKLKGTEFRISFTFLALILLALTVKNLNTLSIVLVFAILHEAVHLIFIYLFSSPPKRVSLSLFGACIERGDCVNKSFLKEIIINTSAPLFNLIIALFFYLLSQVSKGRGELLNILYETNLVLGIFNLIPYHNFDGGNALFNILLSFVNQAVANKIMTAVSLVVAIVFSIISTIVFFNYNHNYALLFTSLYMLLSLMFKKQNTLDY